MAKITSIKKIKENVPQRCIRVSNPNGLFVLSNGLVTHNSPEYIMRLYNDAKGRVWSRMRDNNYMNYYGRTIIDSSPNDLNNPIDDYIVNEAYKDPHNMIVKGSVWQWNPKDYESEFAENKIFKVFTGGKGQPARILESDDPLLESPNLDKTKVIDVPLSMKQLFVDDLNKALKDQAGVPTGIADNLITDYSLLEDMFDNNLRNIYTSIVAPANLSPIDLIWNKVKDIFFVRKLDNYEFYYLPNIPRVVSVDQSYATDMTSISMCHMERIGETGDIIYVVDFTIVLYPSPEKVNLEAIGCFIKDLRNKGHLKIEGVSFDNFQSETTVQSLERDNFNVVKLSVDRTTGPYLNFLSILNRRKVKIGRNIFLKNNLKCIHMTTRGKTKKQVIDHDASRSQVMQGDDSWDKSFLGYFGKDVSDSVVASIELCNKTFDTPVVNWEGGPKKDTTNISRKIESSEKVKNFLDSMGLTL